MSRPTTIAVLVTRVFTVEQTIQIPTVCECGADFADADGDGLSELQLDHTHQSCRIADGEIGDHGEVQHDFEQIVTGYQCPDCGKYWGAQIEPLPDALVALLPSDPATPAAELLAFLSNMGFKNGHTGGGCRALECEDGEGRYSITNERGCDVPTDSDKRVLLGRYDASGDMVWDVMAAPGEILALLRRPDPAAAPTPVAAVEVTTHALACTDPACAGCGGGK